MTVHSFYFQKSSFVQIGCTIYCIVPVQAISMNIIQDCGEIILIKKAQVSERKDTMF